ncbi:MAG TPA: hypothetical protein VLW17_09945 [Thermoanaerobaculaceae bacterium]|nr:hypothetical protein [Thermoanaerobaculaceae bacterium]
MIPFIAVTVPITPVGVAEGVGDGGPDVGVGVGTGDVGVGVGAGVVGVGVGGGGVGVGVGWEAERGSLTAGTQMGSEVALSMTEA